MLHTLLQKKTALTDQMRTLWDKRDKDKKDWTDEETKSYERMSSEVDKLQKEIEQRSLFLKQTEADKPAAEKKFERESESKGF